MHLERTFAYIVAAYLVGVGLFFGLASVFMLPYLHIAPQSKLPVLGVAVVFVVLGSVSCFLLSRGKLRKEGASIAEVRQEAIEKMKDPELLSRIAIRDADSELRDAAMERLQEIKETD